MLTKFLERPFTFDRVARILLVLLIVGVVIWGINSISALLVPFFLAWFCAYLLMPLIRFCERKLKIKSRVLSMTIVLLVVAGILAGIIAILVPSITQEVKKAWELMQYYDIGGVLLSILPEEWQSRTAIYEQLEHLLTSIDTKEILNGIQQILHSSWNIVTSAVDYVIGLGVIFLFLLYLIFIIMDYEVLNKGFFKLFPAKLRPFAHEVADNIEYYVNTYFKGQALIAFICGVVMAIGFYFTGLPLGITTGLFIGLLNLIPYLQNIGYIPLVFLALLQSVSTGQSFLIVLLMSLGVVMFSDLLQNVVLTPSIQGQNMGIRPAVILLSLTVWGSIFGFLGLLFALPLTMILYSFYMKYVVGEPIENGKAIQPVNKPKRRHLFKRKKKEKEEEVSLISTPTESNTPTKE